MNLEQFCVGTRTPYERDATIHDVFRNRARLAPNAVAVRSEAGQLEYGELDRRSDRFARRLQDLGVTAGTTVGVALERSLDVAIVLLGILKAGAAYVPLDTSYPTDRLTFIIEDASVAVVVGERGLADRFAAMTARFLSFDDVAEKVVGRDARPSDVPVRADSRAYIMYTSGSTGRPKGVQIPHRGVVRLVRKTDYVDISPTDVFLQFAPLSFDASTFEIWGALLNGAELAVPPAGPLSLAELAREVLKYSVTILWLTAPLFRLMVESELGGLRGLRCLITGGDVVTPEHVKRFLEAVPNCRLTDGYGPTENTTFSCCYTVPSLDAIRDGVPIGRPIANSTAYVLDSDLQPVEVGTPGELFVGGDGVAIGYLNLPDLTAERFIADPFSSEPGARLYRTGDMARARVDGVLEFLGRIDHQFKIRGFRVELGEIESALRTFPAISDCAVTVVTQGGENVLCAYVVPMRGREMEERELRAHLSTWLPRHMLPTHITVVEALPANSSGKIDRQTLAATSRLLVGQTDHRIADSRASNGAGTSSWKERPTKQRQVALRRTISNLWLESVGGGTELDVDTNFFDAGGDSLRLLKLHERLQHVCDVEVPLFALFENGTIRKMTALVSSLTE